ncbi:hypothetical protein FRB96_004640 [Tulasnella sp. 330]|nr:hypothetical protein FRB96_004640 [Tulasnella sp. 330]
MLQKLHDGLARMQSPTEIDTQVPDNPLQARASPRPIGTPASSLFDPLPLHRLATGKGIDSSVLEIRTHDKLSVSIMIAMPSDRHLDRMQSVTEGEEEHLPELVVGCTESWWNRGGIL